MKRLLGLLVLSAATRARSSSSTPNAMRSGSVPAGALPDMLTFAYGDRDLLVANEGDARDSDGCEEERARDLTLDPAAFTSDEVAELDNRSDNKGPEAGGVDTREVGGRGYAFLAAECQGGLCAYELDGLAPSSRPTPIPGRPTSARRACASWRVATVRRGGRCCWSPTSSAAPWPHSKSRLRRQTLSKPCS